MIFASYMQYDYCALPSTNMYIFKYIWMCYPIISNSFAIW